LTWATSRGAAPRKDGAKFFESLSFAPTSKEEQSFIEATAAQVYAADSPTFYALGRMQSACQERDIPLLMFSVAHGTDRYLYEPAFPQPEPLPDANFKTALALAVDRAGMELGIETTSVDGAMALAVQAGIRLHCGDGHPNAAGHELIAETLQPVIERLLAR